MSKDINRIDIELLLNNEDLLSNKIVPKTSEQNTTDNESILEFEPFDREAFIQTNLPKEYDLDLKLDETFDGDASTIENDFEKNQMVTRLRIKMITNMLKVVYAKFERSGSEEDMKMFVELSYALDSLQKLFLGAHKDLTKVKKDSLAPKSNISTTGTINIQNNTFHGSPNDMLEQYGNAIDYVDRVEGEVDGYDS